MSIVGLHSFGLEVPDVEVAQRYYSDFGLDTEERDSTLVARCAGRDQDQIMITEARRKQLAWVAFSVEPGSLTELSRRVEAAGFRQVDGPGEEGEGVWFTDPDGLPVRLWEAPLAEPRRYEPQTWNMGGQYPHIDGTRWVEIARRPPRPRRLGHVIKYSPDLDRAESFYIGALGLHLSESLNTRLSFWHCGAGDHHIFGASASRGPGLHHSSFEVADFDEMGLGARQMAERGHTGQWGLGRHTFGSNLFVYVRDPWGSWTEYFSDIDQITCAWRPRRWELGEAGSAIWGPPMPKDFHLNVEYLPVGA
jgi:catechol 2,3-dioxygenase-like lactoylglutathione lyase family enzyme